MNRHDRRAAESKRRRSEDKQRAVEMTRADAKRVAAQVRSMRQEGSNAGIVGPDDQMPDPGDGGEKTQLSLIIGERGNLSKAAARKAAEMWERATKQYPRGIYMLVMLGYDRRLSAKSLNFLARP